MRRRGATTLGLRVAALAIPAWLPSGYERYLQLLKAPLFRACDLARATTDLLAATLPLLAFRREAIELPPELFAAAAANRLVVEEGIPSATLTGGWRRDLAPQAGPRLLDPSRGLTRGQEASRPDSWTLRCAPGGFSAGSAQASSSFQTVLPPLSQLACSAEIGIGNLSYHIGGAGAAVKRGRG